jgi:hypothetical protein
MAVKKFRVTQGDAVLNYYRTIREARAYADACSRFSARIGQHLRFTIQSLRGEEWVSRITFQG